MGHAGAAGACARPGLELLAREDVEMVRRKASVALAEIDAAIDPEEAEE